MTGPSLLTRVAIVGAGITGLGMAAALVDAGITDFAIAGQDNELDGAGQLQRHLLAAARVRSAHYQDHDGTWILHTRTGMGFWCESLVVAGYTTNPAAEPVDIRGRQDARLHRRSPHETFLGLAVEGFPNLYLLGGPTGGSGGAADPARTPVQIRYIVDCLEDHYHLGVPLEVRPEAVRGYQEWVDAHPAPTPGAFDRLARSLPPAMAFAAVDPEQNEIADGPLFLPDLPPFDHGVLQ